MLFKETKPLEVEEMQSQYKLNVKLYLCNIYFLRTIIIIVYGEITQISSNVIDDSQIETSNVGEEATNLKVVQ